jgi:Domain of unknown function (DUF5666)
MKQQSLKATRLVRTGLLSITTLALLSACGGGGSSGSGTPASGTPAAQPPTVTVEDGTVGIISGFGSVIVNGVRYDDSSASVKDDHGISLSSSRLGLGMTVHLRGKSNDDGTGSASGINVFSELQGPVSALNAAAGTFTLFGIAVTVDAKTVFADVSGLAALSNGNIVEVYGLRNGNAVTATRIERKTPAAGDAVVKLRGAITGLNAAASTFNLAGLVVSFASAQVTPSNGSLTEGGFVSVSANSAPVGTTLTATRVSALGARSFSFDDRAKSELEGVISGFTSVGQFTVGGITVNATNAVFVRGTVASLANGGRVEIKGTYSNNVLNARLVKFEDSISSDDFEVHGAVSGFTSLANFVVRGIKVDASGAGILFERGVAANIANGRLLEVEGSMQSSASGSILKATKVKFEDASGSSSTTSGTTSVTTPTSTSGSNSGSSSTTGEFEFTGRVTSLTGNTLVVGTRTVNLAANTVFRRIARAQLVAGVLLEIKGNLLANGNIDAERISLED